MTSRTQIGSLSIALGVGLTLSAFADASQPPQLPKNTPYIQIETPIELQKNIIKAGKTHPLKIKKYLDCSPPYETTKNPGINIFFKNADELKFFKKNNPSIATKNVYSCRSFLHHSALGWMASLKNHQNTKIKYFQKCFALGLLNYAKPIRITNKTNSLNLSALDKLPAEIFDLFYQSPFNSLASTGVKTLQDMVSHNLITVENVSKGTIALKTKTQSLSLTVIARADFTSRTPKIRQLKKNGLISEDILVFGILKDQNGHLLEMLYFILSPLETEGSYKIIKTNNKSHVAM